MPVVILVLVLGGVSLGVYFNPLEVGILSGEIVNVLKTLTYFIISTFAAYFYFKKVGNKLTVFYETAGGQYSEHQINKLTITNHKDKTVPIWAVYVVINGEIKIDIYKPKEPLVIKSGEIVSLLMDKYSYLYIGKDRYTPEFFGDKMDFYVNTGSNLIHCKDRRIKDHWVHALTPTMVTRLKFDEHLYNDNVRFILIYFLDGKKYTAFINSNGFIGNEWSLSPNSFGQAEVTPNVIQRMLDEYGYSSIFSNYVCYQRSGTGFKPVFQKQQDPKK